MLFPRFSIAFRSLFFATVTGTLLTSANANTPPPTNGEATTVSQAALDAYIELRRQRRANLWRAFPAEPGAIVFAGSSIIEEGPFQAMFPGCEVVNRGIGADTTIGLLDRIDEIIALRPSALFLYIGGNDRGRLNDTPEAAFERIKSILSRVRAGTPQTRTYLHTLFPREAKHAEWIEALNAKIRSLPGGAVAAIIDVHPLLLGEGGAIDPTLTNDGIHLMPEGYRRWQKVLERGPLSSCSAGG
ncbi:MAG: GDSL-type esterase/lipase family protein [Erythrobacter sp.]